MEKLMKEIIEWKKFAIEDIQKVIKEELAEDIEVLLDCLYQKGLLEKR